jgi:hypothetical protein
MSADVGEELWVNFLLGNKRSPGALSGVGHSDKRRSPGADGMSNFDPSVTIVTAIVERS